MKLLEYFKKKKTFIIGTIREERIPNKNKITLPKKNEFSSFYNEDKTICFTAFNDRKMVFIANTKETVIPLENVNKLQQKRIIPSIVSKYNTYAKGVDKCNRRCTEYRYPHKSRKWWQPVFFHYIQFMINNSYLLAKQNGYKYQHKEFYHAILFYLLGIPKVQRKKMHPMEYIDEKLKSEKRLRCIVCKKKTMFCCFQCDNKQITPLCLIKCFNSFHK